MKKQFACLVTIFTISLFIFPSCGKDYTTPAPKTKTQLLTQSTWKFKSAFAGSTDISSSIQTCQKDNILTFATAGTGTLDEGATKCNSGDPQTNPFTWNFQSSETILFISATLFTGGSSTFTLVSLTETDLVVSQTITPPAGPSFLATVTFGH